MGAILIELFLKSAKTPWHLMGGKRTRRGGAEEGEVAAEGEADLSDDAPAMVHDYVWFRYRRRALCLGTRFRYRR